MQEHCCCPTPLGLFLLETLRSITDSHDMDELFAIDFPNTRNTIRYPFYFTKYVFVVAKLYMLIACHTIADIRILCRVSIVEIREKWLHFNNIIFIARSKQTGTRHTHPRCDEDQHEGQFG